MQLTQAVGDVLKRSMCMKQIDSHIYWIPFPDVLYIYIINKLKWKTLEMITKHITQVQLAGPLPECLPLKLKTLNVNATTG